MKIVVAFISGYGKFVTGKAIKPSEKRKKNMNIITAKEAAQIGSAAKRLAALGKYHDKAMAAQNYREAATLTDQAAVLRQDISRWAALLEHRAATQRSA